MVYIAKDGTIHDGPRPWDMKKVKDTFWSFLHALELFVSTLLPFQVPGLANRAIGSTSNGNSLNFRGSSGTRPRGPTNRTTGGFRTMSDIRPPPPAFGGGCSGGMCGM